MIIAVDFDGTITALNEYPDLGVESPGAFQVLNEMVRRGHKIVLNTMRSGIPLNNAVRFIEEVGGIKLHGVNNTPGQSNWTKSPKVYAHAYIDDAAIGVPKTIEGYVDWNEVRKLLIKAGF